MRMFNDYKFIPSDQYSVSAEIVEGLYPPVTPLTIAFPVSTMHTTSKLQVLWSFSVSATVNWGTFQDFGMTFYLSVPGKGMVTPIRNPVSYSKSYAWDPVREEFVYTCVGSFLLDEAVW